MVNDNDKTPEQLITELQHLRAQVAELEQRGDRGLSEALLRVQLDLALGLTGATSLADTLRLCIQATRSIAGMDAGGVYIVDSVTGAIDLAYSEGLPDDFLATSSHYPPDAPNTLMVMKGQPLHFNFQKLDLAIDNRPSRHGLRATSAFPISYEGEVIACLNVASLSLDELSPSRRNALETIVSQVGNAIARARAEAALKDSAAKLAQAQALTHMGHWSHDPTTGAVEGSDEMFRILGLSRRQASLDALMASVHPEDQPRCRAHLDKAIAQGERWDFEHRVVGKDGALKHVHAIGGPVHDDAGKTAKLSGTVQDITARKRAEDLLRVQRDLAHAFSSATGLSEVLTLILEHTLEIEELDGGGIYLRDPHSDAFDLIAHQGLTQEFVESGAHLEGASPQARLVLAGKPVYAHYDRLGFAVDDVRRRQGMRALSVIPITDKGEVIGCLNVASHTHDEVSEGGRNTLEAVASMIGGAIMRAQSEEERTALQEMLHHSEKMQAIGQLAGGMAHDFNNQLAGIVAYAELLRDDGRDPEHRSTYVDRILLAAKRAADLTGQLLAFARKGKYLSVATDIHHTIVEVVTLLQHSIDKRITITSALDADSHIIKGDPTQLQNTLLNIALNARDAMPDGGDLSITTEVVELSQRDCDESHFELEPGRHIQICIVDSGEGMTEVVQERIFEPFFTTKAAGAGTGMGLAAVYGTMKSHHAAVVVDSELGRGTTFELHLPLAEAPTAEPARARSALSATKTRAHILLVDDELMIRDVTSDLLVELGHEVTTCKDGAEAVATYRSNWQQIDMVILDMVMPNMSGRDTFIAMREINPEVKVMLSSGYSVEGEAQSILDEGALAFVQKPFGVERLARTVEEILGQVVA
jgi:PAS domain S-box-containing protein